ncbi:unnamed protein product [Adineta ricciae]|uniref:Uncharacterized protein n=1 Tax=Adineta ricciae TaxID=249248 RepID=A0A816BXW0_ADIRI|nr:unnamed protein product [Adineta ricciae]
MSSKSAKRKYDELADEMQNTEPTSTVFDKLEISTEYIIIWFDENFEMRKQYMISKIKLRAIVDYLMWFDDMDRCEAYLRRLKHEYVYFVISSDTAQPVVDRVHDLRPVHLIYIYKHDIELKVDWIAKHTKIKTIFNNYMDLLENLSKDLQLFGKHSNLEAAALFLVSKTERTIQLDAARTNSHWFALFLRALIEIAPPSNNKEKFVHECKLFYKNNESVLKVIDEFNETYEAEHAVWWYTRAGFLYRLLNQALRQQYQDAVVLLHFFIVDLYNVLHRLYEQQIDDTAEKEIMYRGQLMNKTELKILTDNTNYAMLINSFLSATFNRQVAMIFAGAKSTTLDDPVQSVLFEISVQHVDTWGKEKVFANIQNMSFNQDESEILFTPGVTLVQREVLYSEEEKAWIVHIDMHPLNTALRLTIDQQLMVLELELHILIIENEGKISQNPDINFTNTINQYIVPMVKRITNESHDLSNRFVFRILRNELRQFFYIPSDHTIRSTLHGCLGTICRDKKDFSGAIEHYLKVIDGSDNRKFSYQVNLAFVYKLQGNFEQAWIICKDLIRSAQEDTNNEVKVYEEVAFGSIRPTGLEPYDIPAEDVRNCEDFIDYTVQNADCELYWIEIKQAYLLAGNFYNESEFVLRCFKKALAIVEKYAPTCHNELSECYQRLAEEYHRIPDIQLAIDYYKKVIEENLAFSMEDDDSDTKSYDSDRDSACDTALAYSKLGQLRAELDDDIEVWNSFRASFNCWKHVSPGDRCLYSLAESYRCLALVYERQQEWAHAINQYELMLYMTLERDPEDKRAVDECCTSILDIQKKLNGIESTTKEQLLNRYNSRLPLTQTDLTPIINQTFTEMNDKLNGIKERSINISSRTNE